MSPALNGSSAIRRFERSDAIKIRDGITFDFYMGLPHMYICYIIIYLVYAPIVFPIEQHDKYFPIFHSPYFIAPRAYAA